MTRRNDGHLTWPKHYHTAVKTIELNFNKNQILVLYQKLLKLKKADACALIVPTQRLDDSAKASMYGGEQNSKQWSYQSPHAKTERDEKQPKAKTSTRTTSRSNHQPHHPQQPQQRSPTNSSLRFLGKNWKQTTTVSKQQSIKRR